MGILTFFMSFGLRKLIQLIFTSDETFLDIFVEAKYPFLLALIFMNVSVAIERVLMSMGRTSEVFWMGVVGSWFGQVPGVYFLTSYWSFDLIGLYSGVAIGYLLLVFLYGTLAYTSDWKKYSDEAIRRSEAG